MSASLFLLRVASEAAALAIVQGDVYFRVRSDPGYGSLSHRSVESMDQGEGLEGSDRKEDPLDFAVWKAAKSGERDHLWESPWGSGRPGWRKRQAAKWDEIGEAGSRRKTTRRPRPSGNSCWLMTSMCESRGETAGSAIRQRRA